MSTPPVTTPRPVSAFIQLWADAASTVLQQIVSAAYPITVAPAEEMPASAAGDVQLTITATGTARGEMSLRVPAPTAIELAKVFTANPDVPGPEPSADDRAALEELFRQFAGHVVTSARPKGLEIQLTTALGETPTWSPGASGCLRSGAGAPQQLQIEWKLSSALATALVTTWQEPEAAKPAPPPEIKKEVKATKDANLPSKLDLLMDVELDVTLRFGGRNLLLKEILDLGPGSVLELDRDIQDEADLYLDGKLIARGEVVSIEGNFGLRVTEVLAARGS
ncbi:MAG TPA: flagellar motor switch protein FliN [Terriglobales bacterium]|nr:flagellar motor switch protein FliN [Terriglobales bacterium]